MPALSMAESLRHPVGPVASAPAAPQRVTSAELLNGARKLLIEHDGEVYTLHLTRQNKLLLTK